jgi:hypothetical protein
MESDAMRWILTLSISFTGIGVAAILGVNIWKSLSIEKRIKSIISKEIDIIKEENKKMKDKLVNYTKAMSFLAEANRFHDNDEFDESLDRLATCIKFSLSSEEEKLTSIALNCFLTVLHDHGDDAYKMIESFQDKDGFRDVLLQIQDPLAYELYAYFFPVFQNDKV